MENIDIYSIERILLIRDSASKSYNLFITDQRGRSGSIEFKDNEPWPFSTHMDEMNCGIITMHLRTGSIYYVIESHHNMKLMTKAKLIKDNCYSKNKKLSPE